MWFWKSQYEGSNRKGVLKTPRKKGWHLKSIKGSHNIYMKEGRKERIGVPVHSNKNLKIGLLKALMRIAEIEESEL